MKRWQQWARIGATAAAGVILVATALPKEASAAGLSAPKGPVAVVMTGTVTGTVTVTGAPAGFAPAYTGAGACPTTTPVGQVCADPIYSLASGGTYTLSLPTGSWELDGFYEVNAFGGAFLGASQTVTVSPGGIVTQNLTVSYQTPSTIKGKIRVTAVPTGVQVEELSVLLCPSFAPYNGITPSIACVSGGPVGSALGATSAPYKVTGLPPGTWTAYPGYCTEFGCATNAMAGKSVTVAAGGSATAVVTTPFILPGEGLLTGTVTVTGAPPDFADPIAVSACQLGGGNCQSFYEDTGDSFTLLLADGQWTVNGTYLASPFDNAVAGPTETVTVVGGHETTLPLTVAYQVPGTGAGTISVTGKPAHVPISSYTVLACPASSPWTGGEPSPECASEYSGPGGYGFGAADRSVSSRLSPALRPPAGHVSRARSPYNQYQLTTLTPGSWILYPGYETVFGSYIDPSGTTVTIASGVTTTQRLTVPYQAPSVGVVTGTVTVIGAPQNGFESGAQACSAPPTATSCADEQDAYNESSDAYQLLLEPGTWWVSGFVDVYGFGPGENETTTLPVEVTVTPGSQSKENFTVTVAAS